MFFELCGLKITHIIAIFNTASNYIYIHIGTCMYSYICISMYKYNANKIASQLCHMSIELYEHVLLFMKQTCQTNLTCIACLPTEHCSTLPFMLSGSLIWHLIDRRRCSLLLLFGILHKWIRRAGDPTCTPPGFIFTDFQKTKIQTTRWNFLA